MTTSTRNPSTHAYRSPTQANSTAIRCQFTQPDPHNPPGPLNVCDIVAEFRIDSMVTADVLYACHWHLGHMMPDAIGDVCGVTRIREGLAR